MITYNGTKLEAIRQDITTLKVDAVVNAANNSLLGGGGVDGAIHRKGGAKILEACKKIGGCATGDAVITTAGNLPSRYVIHTVGPIFSDSKRDREELYSCYKKSLALAEEYALESVAFSSISTGVYSFPKEEACDISVRAVLDFLSEKRNLQKIIFCVFSEEQLNLYEKRLKEI